MNEEDVRRVAKITVEETLVTLGVEVDDPLEVQRDFQYMRDLRLATAAVKRKGLLTIVGILAAGACAMLWVGITNGGS